MISTIKAAGKNLILFNTNLVYIRYKSELHCVLSSSLWQCKRTMRTALFCRTKIISSAFIFLWFNRGPCEIWLLLIHTRPMPVQIRRVQMGLEPLHKWVQVREITWSLHIAKERMKKTYKPPWQISPWLFHYFYRCPSGLDVYCGLHRYIVPTSAAPRFATHNLESEKFISTWSVCSIILFSISNCNQTAERNTLQQEKNDLIIVKKCEQCSGCQPWLKPPGRSAGGSCGQPDPVSQTLWSLITGTVAWSILVLNADCTAGQRRRADGIQAIKKFIVCNQDLDCNLRVYWQRCRA